MTFTANYKGWCDICGEQLQGEEVVHDGSSLVHIDCAPDQPDGEEVDVADDWVILSMVHADCERCRALAVTARDTSPEPVIGAQGWGGFAERDGHGAKVAVSLGPVGP